tara:strand:- start:669 stop:1556 length:888 start_codon:yes stop_codon:yes gene_type:complete
MRVVEDAIILAGGMGTRMLPASLYAPKETMPLIDTPILNHLIWEAAKAGVKRVHLVLSDRKRQILEGFIQGKVIIGENIREDLPNVAKSFGVEGVEVVPYVQENPGGVADAISTALHKIEGAFLVLLGDMLILENHNSPKDSGPDKASRCSSLLVSMFQKSGLPCVGVCQVERKELSNYGVVEIDGNRVVSITEKPIESEARSDFVLCGRYLFPSNTSEILEEYPIAQFGEMQSIFVLRHLIDKTGLNAVRYEKMQMFDSGDPLSWLKSQIDHGLRREDISVDLSRWISERMSRI